MDAVVCWRSVRATEGSPHRQLPGHQDVVQFPTMRHSCRCNVRLPSRACHKARGTFRRPGVLVPVGRAKTVAAGFPPALGDADCTAHSTAAGMTRVLGCAAVHGSVSSQQAAWWPAPRMLPGDASTGQAVSVTRL
jgi:hypothetical protein